MYLPSSLRVDILHGWHTQVHHPPATTSGCAGALIQGDFFSVGELMVWL